MATILLCTNSHRNDDTANMLKDFQSSSRSRSFTSVYERSVRFIELTVNDEQVQDTMSFFEAKYPETSARNITQEFRNAISIAERTAEPVEEQQPSLLEKITTEVSDVIGDMIPKQPEAQLVNA